MSTQQRPRDLFDLFCDFIVGQAQIQIFLQLLTALAILLLFRFTWNMICPSIAEENDYHLSTDRIELIYRPLWIPPSLQSDAITDNSNLFDSASLSLLNPKLAENLMNAFRAEPWVREVNSVRLEYPAKVLVDAQFREPVAFVERTSTVKDGVSSRTAYQIDADGILLPTDFLAAVVSTNPSAVYDYLWIEGIRSTPIGSYGKPWNDPILDESALLADFLHGSFKQLGIAKILIPDENENSNVPVDNLSSRRIWRLETVKGREIIWGSFPMSAVIRAQSGSRTDYENAKREAFRHEEPKLIRLINLSKGKSLDELEEKIFPIDLTDTE